MFNFRVNLGELLATQEVLTHAIGTKRDKPILQMVHIEIQKHALIMRAFNHVIQIEATCPIVNEGPLVQFCVPGFMFTVLDKYAHKQNTVEFKQMMDKTGEVVSKFTVSQEVRSNEFMFIEAENYPDKVTLQNYAFKDIGPLLEAFTLTQPGVADTAKAPSWRCYQLTGGRLLTGDGIQFGRYAGLEDFPNDVLLRAKGVMEDMKLLAALSEAGDCEIDTDDNWFGFRSPSLSIEIIFQRYTGDTVDTNRVFEMALAQEPISTVLVDLEELKAALELSVLYENQALLNAHPAYTAVSVTEGKIIFEINVKDLSASSEEVLASTTGESFTTHFLSSKLYEVVSLLKCESVLIEFFSSVTPFRVTAEEYPNFEYLQSP